MTQHIINGRRTMLYLAMLTAATLIIASLWTFLWLLKKFFGVWGPLTYGVGAFTTLLILAIMFSLTFTIEPAAVITYPTNATITTVVNSTTTTLTISATAVTTTYKASPLANAFLIPIPIILLMAVIILIAAVQRELKR